MTSTRWWSSAHPTAERANSCGTYFDYKCYRIRTEGISEHNLDLHAVLYTRRPLKFSSKRGFNLFAENWTHYPLLSTPIPLTTGLGRRIDIKRSRSTQSVHIRHGRRHQLLVHARNLCGGVHAALEQGGGRVSSI